MWGADNTFEQQKRGAGGEREGPSEDKTQQGPAIKNKDGSGGILDRVGTRGGERSAGKDDRSEFGAVLGLIWMERRRMTTEAMQWSHM